MVAAMVIVMAPGATEADIAHVVERVESVGGSAFVSKGVERTIIGLVITLFVAFSDRDRADYADRPTRRF